MNKMLWDHRKFKLFDKVKIRHSDIIGYVDAITPQGNIRVKTNDGYEWCSEYELEFTNKQMNNVKRKTNLDYLG